MILTSKGYKRARARGVLALLIALGTLSSCATFDDYEPVSAFDRDASFAIYTASVARMKYVGSPPCPENYLCLDAVFELTAQPIERIAGNPSIGRETFQVIQHTGFSDGITLLIHARRDEEGDWAMVDYTPLNLEACLNVESAKEATTLDKADSDWHAIEDPGNKEVCISRYFRSAPS